MSSSIYDLSNMEFSTKLYTENSEEIDINELKKKISMNDDYLNIDNDLGNKIIDFIRKKTYLIERRYVVIASEIAMVMLSDLRGYIDNESCKFLKIVQIGVDNKYQRLGICKKLLSFIIEKTKQSGHLKYIMIECVNNKHLYNYLLKSTEWKLMPCANENFYIKLK